MSQPAAPELAAFRAPAGAFHSWHRAGLDLAADGSLTLLPDSESGEATGPVHETASPFRELIASWNAFTPPGAWLETLARIALPDDRWTRWYSLGLWTAAESGDITRHSVARQEDPDARVSTDVLTLRRTGATRFQLAVRLHRRPGAGSPSLRSLFAATSLPASAPAATSQPTQTNLLIELPQCSQMIYPDGGNVWCSPTCVSMVLARWLPTSGPCEPRVRAAVEGVYDHVYRGHGNWPFNTAYAFHAGHAAGVDLESYVFRLPDLAAAEPWLASGVPLILSYGWRQGELTGAPIATSNGHLVVLAGLDHRGDPIIHDPAAPSNETVRRTYQRDQVERLWLSHSAGTAYAIYPTSQPVPAA